MGSNISGKPFSGKKAGFLFIFMGASNLARGHNGLETCIRRSLAPRPVEILSALGPGRAYCSEGGMWNVVYPPIGTCGILNALQKKVSSDTKVLALITDIGNDIMYGVPTDEIIACLQKIFDELHAVDAHILVTAIPVDLEYDVGEFYFRCIRLLFYPRSKVTYRQAIEAIRSINLFLKESAGQRIDVFNGMQEFTGGDKIHYSLFKSHRGWTVVVSRLLGSINKSPVGGIGWVRITWSLLINLGRLFFKDMMHFGKRRVDFY